MILKLWLIVSRLKDILNSRIVGLWDLTLKEPTTKGWLLSLLDNHCFILVLCYAMLWGPQPTGKKKGSSVDVHGGGGGGGAVIVTIIDERFMTKPLTLDERTVMIEST